VLHDVDTRHVGRPQPHCQSLRRRLRSRRSSANHWPHLSSALLWERGRVATDWPSSSTSRPASSSSCATPPSRCVTGNWARHATYADQPGRYAVQPLRYPPAGARCASPCNSPTCRVAAIRTIHGETTNKHPQVSTPRQARFRHKLRRWHPSPSCSASLVKQYKSPKQGVRQAFDEGRVHTKKTKMGERKTGETLSHYPPQSASTSAKRNN